MYTEDPTILPVGEFSHINHGLHAMIEQMVIFFSSLIKFHSNALELNYSKLQINTGKFLVLAFWSTKTNNVETCNCLCACDVDLDCWKVECLFFPKAQEADNYCNHDLLGCNFYKGYLFSINIEIPVKDYYPALV
jgi:hypothetical protein